MQSTKTHSLLPRLPDCTATPGCMPKSYEIVSPFHTLSSMPQSRPFRHCPKLSPANRLLDEATFECTFSQYSHMYIVGHTPSPTNEPELFCSPSSLGPSGGLSHRPPAFCRLPTVSLSRRRPLSLSFTHTHTHTHAHTSSLSIHTFYPSFTAPSEAQSLPRPDDCVQRTRRRQREKGNIVRKSVRSSPVTLRCTSSRWPPKTGGRPLSLASHTNRLAGGLVIARISSIASLARGHSVTAAVKMLVSR
ncbi:unnamed protein product [Protopolystoma xenopodis]|uniref:Uncharacterized protein n=1 Tax=Protopolystoma xenopodis TaxID=117903 RepID=A0A3S5AZS2_9PLAT|nr:unnamed protein product [Protopolystoma xenopodis]